MPLGVASTQLGRSSAVLNDGVKATLTYLGIYAAMNLGAFTCVALVARRHPRAAIEDVRGLVYTAPVTAVLLAFFLTALAGLPPGVAGLFAKVVVLRAAVRRARHVARRRRRGQHRHRARLLPARRRAGVRAACADRRLRACAGPTTGPARLRLRSPRS